MRQRSAIGIRAVGSWGDLFYKVLIFTTCLGNAGYSAAQPVPADFNLGDGVEYLSVDRDQSGKIYRCVASVRNSSQLRWESLSVRFHFPGGVVLHALGPDLLEPGQSALFGLPDDVLDSAALVIPPAAVSDPIAIVEVLRTLSDAALPPVLRTSPK